MSGITNPFATNLPKPWEMDAALAQIEHNKLVGEDLRSQIAEREANRTALGQLDFGGAPGGGTGTAATGGTGGTGGTAPAPAAGTEGWALGMRQNNPGNLMFAGQPGATLGQGNRFAIFPDMATGVAAHAAQLAINQERHGVNTVRGQVTRWVSDPKADLTSYIANTAKALGVDPDAPVDWTNPKVQAAFIQAQQPHESGGGGAVLNPADVEKGVQLYAANRGQQVQAPGTQTATAPAPATPGVAARTGGTDVAGPGGGRVVPPAIGAAARQLLAMPEDQAAAAYPRVLQELRAAGVDMPNAPATYPGHDAVQRMVDGMAPQAPAAPAPAAPATVAPQAPATPQATPTTPTTPTVPAPTPPPPTNDRNLTADNLQQLDLLRRSKGATLATVATAMSQMQAHNQALAAQYRTDLEQAGNTAYTRSTAATTAAATQAERDYQHKKDADAAARQGLPPGWHIGPDGKPEQIPEVKAAESQQPFPGQAEPAQLRNTLLTKDPKSPEFHAAWEAYANPHEANGVLVQGHNMEPFKLPLDADGNAVTTYAKPPMAIGPGDLTQLRKIETEAGSLTSALDEFAKVSRDAGIGERAKTVAGLSTDLRSAWTNAALMAKGEALFNLGVLSGPDMTVIRGALADPSTFFGASATQETIDKQVGRIKRLLQTRLDQARQSYAPGVSRGTPDAKPDAPAKGERPPLSSFGR